ncbi:Uncharacterized protein ABC855_g4778 [[Candida] zeylanoides]
MLRSNGLHTAPACATLVALAGPAWRRASRRASLTALAQRTYAAPPRPSLICNGSSLSTFWNNRVPSTYKYFALVVAAAGALRYVHPNTLVTAGPPVAIGGWLAYRWFTQKYLYKRELAKVAGAPTTLRIRRYDPASVEAALSGIENEFDSFRSQVIPLVETQLVDALAQRDPLRLFGGSQISARLGADMETFVVLPIRHQYMPVAALDEAFTKFIVFSVPLYSRRRRVATAKVYMLERKDGAPGDHEFAVALELKRYSLWGARWLLRDLGRPASVINM